MQWSWRCGSPIRQCLPSFNRDPPAGARPGVANGQPGGASARSDEYDATTIPRAARLSGVRGRVPIAIILLIASVARLWGLDFGLPSPYCRPDEEAVAAVG